MNELSLIQWLIATGVLAALLYGLHLITQRLQQKRIALGGQRLRVIEQRFIDPKNKLVLVQHDKAEILLAVGPNGVVKIDT